MYNGIINGSILKFQAKVTVPALGNPFTTLKFTDYLSEGLRYIDENATEIQPLRTNAIVEYRLATDPDVDDSYTLVNPAAEVIYPYPDTVVGPTELVIRTSDSSVVDPAADIVVRVTFYVVVTDVVAALDPPTNTLVNNSTFQMLDSTDQPIGLPEEGNLTLEIIPYSLYVFGISRTMQKVPNIDVPGGLVYFFGATTGEENDNLIYELEILKNENFDFDIGTEEDNYPNLIVTSGRQGTVLNRTVEVNDATGNVKVSIPHSDTMDNETIYLYMKASTNDNLTLEDEDPQFILGNARIKDVNGATLAPANQYNAEVNFIGAEKSLTDGSKILVS